MPFELRMFLAAACLFLLLICVVALVSNSESVARLADKIDRWLDRL